MILHLRPLLLALIRYITSSMYISSCVLQSTTIHCSYSSVASCCLYNPITCCLEIFHSVLVHSPVLRLVVTELMPDVTASHIIDSSASPHPTPPHPRLSHRGRCRIFRLSFVSQTLSKRFYINRLLALIRVSKAPKQRCLLETGCPGIFLSILQHQHPAGSRVLIHLIGTPYHISRPTSFHLPTLHTLTC